jgi:hypothetical protein
MKRRSDGCERLEKWVSAAGIIAIAGAALASAIACSSPEPQNGTNTNWACKVDVDCARMSELATCEDGFCKLSSARGAVTEAPTGSSLPSPDAKAPPSVPDAGTDTVCGDSLVTADEECDLGPGRNLPGSGCEPDCRYSCLTDPECSDHDFCNGIEICTIVSTGRKCMAGIPVVDGVICGDHHVCMKQQDGKVTCVQSTGP